MTPEFLDPVIDPAAPLELDASEETKPWLRGVYDAIVIVCAVWLGLLTSTAEAFFTPLRMFGYLVPISVIGAVLITPLLCIYSFRLTGRRALSLLPAIAWVFAALLWSQGTSEGDVVLAGDSWVSMLYLLGGSGAAAFGAYKVLLARKPDSVRRLELPTESAV